MKEFENIFIKITYKIDFHPALFPVITMYIYNVVYKYIT